MADIAQIGFAADTSQLDKAKTSLQSLVPAAQAVEAAAADVAQAFTETATASTKVSNAAKGVQAATASASNVIDIAAGRTRAQKSNVDALTTSYEKLETTQQRINRTTSSASGNDTSSRAADIQAYGKALDELRGKYNPLFAAGQQYKATLSDINSAYKVGAINQKEYSNIVTSTKAAFVDQVKAIQTGKKANDDLAHSHQGLSTQAMAAQHSIRSMVEQIAMGMPPTTVLSTQLNHLAYAASGPGGITKAFKDAIGSLTGLFSKTTAIVGGVVALAAAFAFMSVSVIKSLLALDDLSKETDTAVSKLHALQQSMSFKGISNDEFVAGMQGFAKATDDAEHNVGSLNGLMIASGKSAHDLEGYMASVADIVAKTQSNVQKRNILEAASLPTTQAWVRYMSQGGDAIRNAANNTVEFNEKAEQNLIAKARAFDEAWNKATTNVSNYLKSIITDNLEGINKFIKVIEFGFELQSKISKVTSPVRTTKPGGSLDPNSDQFTGPKFNPQPGDGAFTGPLPGANDNKKKNDQQTQQQLLEQNRQAQQRISLLGDMATVEQQVTQKQLELNAASLQGVGVTKEQNAAIINATRAQAEMSRVQQQSAIGIYNERDARKAAADTLQMWIDKGLIDKNNVEQMAAAQQTLKRSLDQTKEAAQLAAAPLQQLKQLELDSSNLSKQLDGTLTQSLQGLVSPIQDVLNGVTSLGQGFKNMGVVVLKAIQEMIIKMLILAPIAKGLQGIFGGFFGSGDVFGGATGSIQVGSQSFPKFANGGTFTNQIVNRPTRFAYGGKMGEMGEAGPEAIMPLQRGPDGSLGVQMYGGASNDNPAPQVTYAPTYHVAQGADPQAIAELRKAQAQDRREFTSNVGKAVLNLRKRNNRV